MMVVFVFFFCFFLKQKDSYFFFFFFQAEDGIRDHCVTGVQTCALPILWSIRPMKNRRGGIGIIMISGSGIGPVTLRLNAISLSPLHACDYHPWRRCAKFDLINWRT